MKITGYTIIDKIAAGGMSTVYLAEKTGSGQRVALKVLSSELTADLSFLQRFIDEAEIIAQLRHSAIVPILDYGQSGSHAYIAMEYLPGGNLRERIESGLTEADILKIITRIAEALGHTHLKGVLHLDVTPRNILFRNNGDAVLADFGVSKKYLVPDFEQPTAVMGNPRYLSPEQIRGDRTDPKTDLYSLGVIFYEMLAGRLPFEAETAEATAQMHLDQIPDALPEHYSYYQPIIDQLLEKIPEQRFHSAGDFLNALNDLHTSVAVLDDKTVIYPVKQMAAGGGRQPVSSVEAGYNTHIYELDHIPKIPEFSDHTDPLPTDDITRPAKRSSGDTIIMEAEKPAGPAVPDDSEQRELPEILVETEVPDRHDEVETPVIVTLKAEPQEEATIQSKKSLLDLEQDFTDGDRGTTDYKVVDPEVLVAVRDDLHTSSLGEKRFSLLNVIVILALFSGALWLWTVYKETIVQFVENKTSGMVENVAGEPGSETSSTARSTSLTQQTESVRPEKDASGRIERPSSPDKQVSNAKQSNLVKSKARAPAAIQQPVNSHTRAASQTGPIHQQTANTELTETEEINTIPVTEIVLEPDTGLELSEDQFIISYQLERALKYHTDTLQRQPDGSLAVFLEQPRLYQSESGNLHPEALNLLSRLAYVFRNNHDFLVQVTDRTTRVDSPDGYRFSSYRANNIKDFLIAQGLSPTRITSRANSQLYQSSFSGVEIRLTPNLENLADKGNSNDQQAIKRP